MRSPREREADALVRLYRPSWTHTDPSTGGRVRRRSETWWADYREGGQRRRESLGTPFKSDAELARGRILDRLRRKAAGLVDPCADHAARPIAEHVADFEATARARESTAEHVDRVLGYLREGLAAMGAKRIADLDLATASRWLSEVRAQGWSARTVNVRAQSLRSFGRWLAECRRATHDPFLGLRPLNVETDRRRVRRALTADEAVRLVEAAARRPLADAEANAALEAEYRRRHGKPSARGRAAEVRPEVAERLRLLGQHRALVYAFALGTGVRRGETGRLRWQDLDLEAGMLTIPAASAKARREQVLPLSGSVHEALKAARERRADEPGGALVFPPADMPSPRTFRRDLLAAGIQVRASDGTVLDFHALRVTLGTRLCEANVPLVQAQRLLRHADPKLTATIYTKPTSTDLRAALDRLAPPGVSQPRLTTACHETALRGPLLATGGPKAGPRGFRSGFGPGAPRTGLQGRSARCGRWWALQESNL